MSKQVVTPFASKASVLGAVSSRQKGQSAAEYALILGLVAVVVIVAAFGIGLAAQRVYGLVAAALGARHDTAAHHTIEITSAQCISVAAQNQTGLWITGLTDETISDLTGSTEFGLSPVSANGPGGFVFHPLIASAADVSKCPRSVAIQAKDGALAEAPITAVSE